jgi:hypothetical protein
MIYNEEKHIYMTELPQLLKADVTIETPEHGVRIFFKPEDLQATIDDLSKRLPIVFGDRDSEEEFSVLFKEMNGTPKTGYDFTGVIETGPNTEYLWRFLRGRLSFN